MPAMIEIDSPIGALTLVASGGALTRIDFGRTAAPAAARLPADDDAVLVEATRQLGAYFAGELRDFDLPLNATGTEFQRRVWARLREIPYGATTTYGALAGGLGLAGHGARAVGAANGRNPIPVVVPCHRVIGSDGTLTGYAGGLGIKRTLLELEGVAVPEQLTL